MGSILLKRLHTGGFLVLFLLAASIGWGQGLEDFTNSNAGTGYTSGTFTGNNAIDWSYVASRDGNGDANNSGIILPAIMLRRVADNSKVTSSAIPNGIGNFSVKLYKGFTGVGDRQVELFINGTSKGVSTPFDDTSEHIFAVNGIDVSGSVIIEIRNSTSRQVIIDDITWTAFGGGGNTGPFISNITQNPSNSNVTSSDPVSVSADLVDSDGIASAKLHWGTVSGTLTNTINMNLVSGTTYTTIGAIPAQADGTTVYYEIEATDSNATPLTTTSAEQSYLVEDPIPFDLPYFNGLRIQDDYDEAVSQGFGFSKANMLVTTAGGYIKIDANESITSPAIDFSGYNDLTVIFDIATYGGNNAQALNVLVSNDNGATYTSLAAFAPASSTYETFTQFIDLTTLNGTNGRIKFEVPAGAAGSIRFRNLSILPEFQGFFYSNTNWVPSNPDGVSTTNDDLYIINGTTSLTASTAARNIKVNEGATLNIGSVLTIARNITNNGNLIFLSSATGNGELAQVPSTSTITGDVTVQRYMSHNRSYRMVSSAVTTTTSIHDNWQEGATSNIDNPKPGFGTHITGTTVDQLNGFDKTISANPSMFTADVLNQKFDPISNTDVNVLEAGDAYLLFVRGDRSIDLTNDLSANETILRTKGSLFSGTQTQSFPATTTAGDFVMFGNPYQSAVDINSVFANSSNIDNTQYYVYDPNLGTHGAYVTVQLPAGNISSVPSSDADKYLQPGQAAQAANVTASVSSVVFKEADKAPGNFTATHRNGNMSQTEKTLFVQLYTADNFNNSGPVHDGFVMFFEDGNDNGITLKDSRKPMNFYENLGLNHNGKLLSIEKREFPQPGEVFELFSNGYETTDYVLKMTLDELDDTVFYLDDKFTGSSTLMEIGDTAYNFSVVLNDPLSTATDRFSIRTEQRLGVDSNNLLSGIRLFPNPLSADTFYINAPGLDDQQLMVSVTDLSGRRIFEQTLDCRADTVTVPVSNDLAAGIYLVTLTHKGEKQTLRLIKE